MRVLRLAVPESEPRARLIVSLRSTDAVAAPRAAFEIARLHNRVIRSVPFCAERNWPWRKETALPIMHEERAADTWSKVGVRPQPSVQPHLALLAAICSGVGCSV